jgi:DNA-binding phage protein
MDAETYPYDSARYLKDDGTIAAYMDEAFKTGDPASSPAPSAPAPALAA